jgi:hypothetical protein
MRLFGRHFRLQVGELVSTDLDIKFKVTRAHAARPGTAEITIHNLTPAHRSEILKSPRARHWLLNAPGQPDTPGQPGTVVELAAGYAADAPTIFRGTLRRAVESRDGDDWVITVTAGDGAYAIRSARVRRSFAADTQLGTVIRAIADAMQVGYGNLDDVLPGAQFERVGAIFPEGTVLHGQAADELTALCRSAGLEWSIQDGHLLMLERGAAIRRQAVVLSPDTGLVGSPERNGRRRAKAKALLIPDLVPGRIVDLRSDVIAGEFRILHAEYTGDTSGGDWYAALDLVRFEKVQTPLLRPA